MVNEKDAIIIAMLQDLITLTKGIKSPEVDMTKIEALTNRLQQVTDNTSTYMEQISKISEQIRKPIKTKHCHTFDIRSGHAFVVLIMLVIISALAMFTLLAEREEVAPLRDNDLKYRYIKMKGVATPLQILDLEDMFEVNRDYDKIEQIYKDVKQYENAVHKQAIAVEQARLNKLEVDRLNAKAKSLKNK